MENNKIVIEVKNWHGERIFTTSWNPSKLTPTLGTVLVQVEKAIRTRLEGIMEMQPQAEGASFEIEPPEEVTE